jgi:hypothetical protein
MTMSGVQGGSMDTLINGFLLVGVLGLPGAIVFFLTRAVRRRGLYDQYEQPDRIDYDKW